MPERENDTSPPTPEGDQAAMERYREHQERMLRYDREYLERLKQAQPAPRSAAAAPDLPWGHPICDRCAKRVGCGLQQAMRKVDSFKAGTRSHDEGDGVPEDVASPPPGPDVTGLAAPAPPKTVDLATLPPHHVEAARELAARLDADDARCMLAFGTKPQNTLAAATKAILGTSRTSSASEAQATLAELLQTLHEADADAETGPIGKLVHRIPVIGGGQIREARKVVRAYEPLASKIARIERKLREQEMTLLTDHENLDRMFAENADFIEQLRVYIAAGQLRLDELEQRLQAMRWDPEQTNDELAVQACDDCRRAIDRLSQRIYDLELTRLIAVQTGPQIRLIQDGDERLATRIHTAVLTTIPLWQRQVALAISLAHQKEALKTVKGVTDSTNDLLRANAEDIKRGTLDVRTETERGVVDIDTLRATTDDLITTVEDALRTSAEGRAKRAEGERRIADMEERIRSMLATKRSEGETL